MYYIVYGFLWLFSLIPMRMLYFFSDGVYILLYYVFKYRRDVVESNLKYAFPEKSEAERKVIAKKFYHNFIDTFIESIKLLSVSDKFLAKRFTGNWEVINALSPTGRSIQLHLGHNFNWEWANVVASKKFDYPFLGVYMPLRNKVFDRLFRSIRSRSGTKLLSAKNMARDFAPYSDTKYLLTLVADQNPGNHANCLWFNFLNRPTPFVNNPAKKAIANNLAVFFAFIHKPKRGYYEAVFMMAEENASATTEVELTRKFVRYLEEVIHQYPDMWLWSHRRWKREWKEEYGPVL